MHLKSKKIFSIILIVVMLISNSVSLYAGNDGDDSKDEQSSESSVIKGFSGAREAREEDILESRLQMQKPDFLYQREVNHINAAGWYELSNFPYYGQEKNYSCGPACIKMALKYLTGIVYAESTIQVGCGTVITEGTYLSDMKAYINGQQNKNNYVAKYGENQTTMTNNLYSGIVSYDAPPVIGIKEVSRDGWRFDIDAHFVAIYAVKSDRSGMKVADPWAGYVGSGIDDTKYEVSSSNIYTGYSRVSCGYMY